jgi:hypothetical protein
MSRADLMREERDALVLCAPRRPSPNPLDLGRVTEGRVGLEGGAALAAEGVALLFFFVLGIL